MDGQTLRQYEVNTANLSTLIDTQFANAKIISFDCFDTLVWRKCAHPTDVFYELQESPAFKKRQFHATLRIQAEIHARQRQLVESGYNEISLKDIYLTAFPDLTAAEIEELSNAEIACEMQFCYPYPPMVALLKKANELQKKIIIVSDTYLQAAQLKNLLSATLESAATCIQHIFVSNEARLSKSQGVFKKLIPHLKVNPEHIFHIGDHPIADLKIPRENGVNAFRFLQHSAYTEQLLRLQNVTGHLLYGNTQIERPSHNIYKATLAKNEQTKPLPETYIGYHVLGPLLHAFSVYLKNEMTELQKSHPTLKIAFLLRDGYLPWLACKTLQGHEVGQQIRVSRFAAFAASFRSHQDIRDYVATVLPGERYADICKQLLLPHHEIEQLVKQVAQAENPKDFFRIEILKPQRVNMIVAASQEYFARLWKYFEKSLALKSGDSLLLIDLGYSGTTQRQLTPILQKEKQVTLLGRYLISLRTPDWQNNRGGLIDASWCHDNAMLMIVSYIALLEQLCTTTDKSVIDFADDGEPIYAETSLNADQHDKLIKIQAECIRFIAEAEAAQPLIPTLHELRHTALAILGRLIFLPTKIEMDYLQTFKFDLNLGTTDTFTMFNPHLGMRGLRERGLFFMERNSKTLRTNYPAELRYAGLELALSLMSQHRFNLAFNVTDMSLRKQEVPIIVLSDKQSSQHILEAQPTFDGYFALFIPVSHLFQHIGILIGQKYKWLQVESISLIKLAALHTEAESKDTIVANEYMTTDQVKIHDGQIYECQTAESLIMLNVPTDSFSKQCIFRFVYRPLVTI